MENIFHNIGSWIKLHDITRNYTTEELIAINKELWLNYQEYSFDLEYFKPFYLKLYSYNSSNAKSKVRIKCFKEVGNMEYIIIIEDCFTIELNFNLEKKSIFIKEVSWLSSGRNRKCVTKFTEYDNDENPIDNKLPFLFNFNKGLLRIYYKRILKTSFKKYLNNRMKYPVI